MTTSPLRVISCLMVAATVLIGATADTYTVGDGLGWEIPPGGAVAYRVWASRKSFELGDTIVFKWNGTHTVARVSKEDYDSCTSTNTIGSIKTTSPATFTLDSNATQYFICTVNSHCSLGQKVAIAIGASAPSLTTGTLWVVLLALAISVSSHM